MAHGQYWHTMSKAQQQACLKLWLRFRDPLLDNPTYVTYPQFRRQFRLYDYYGGRETGSYWGRVWRGIFYGIETDGYTHT